MAPHVLHLLPVAVITQPRPMAQGVPPPPPPQQG